MPGFHFLLPAALSLQKIQGFAFLDLQNPIQGTSQNSQYLASPWRGEKPGWSLPLLVLASFYRNQGVASAVAFHDAKKGTAVLTLPHPTQVKAQRLGGSGTETQNRGEDPEETSESHHGAKKFQRGGGRIPPAALGGSFSCTGPAGEGAAFCSQRLGRTHPRRCGARQSRGFPGELLFLPKPRGP